MRSVISLANRGATDNGPTPSGGQGSLTFCNGFLARVGDDLKPPTKDLCTFQGENIGLQFINTAVTNFTSAPAAIAATTTTTTTTTTSTTNTTTTTTTINNNNNKDDDDDDIKAPSSTPGCTLCLLSQSV
ncbi:hypothetical protein PoB_002436500 [Plakobranchus ocellatus]|uniref:Uncharacterized protein n=1 Tax=Plakobranchus ocellatus TaxID=259542 RepID=A0AAV3ZRT9_9GAST|nr:hypothetical protein PoB_002436500 [Plakobranchus ocellatus]